MIHSQYYVEQDKLEKLLQRKTERASSTTESLIVMKIQF